MRSVLNARLAAVVDRLAAAAGGGVVGIAAGERELLVPFGQIRLGDTFDDARADDRFALTSITKPFTALQVMSLVDAGRLDLDAPIAAYVPEFAAAGKEQVTCRHVLSHTSGIDPSANSAEGPPSRLEGADHLAIALAAGLSTSPGEVFAYCSPPFWVLGELISRLSGLSLAEHLAAFVTGPMEASSTVYWPQRETPFRLADPRCAPDRAHVNEHARLTSYPAGGLIGTAGDMLALGRCMLHGGAAGLGRVVSSAAVRLMGAPTASGVIAGRSVRWGLGWELGGPGSLQSPDGFYHSGASGVALWIDPSRSLTAVVLTDTWGVPRRTFAEVINGIVAALDYADDTSPEGTPL
jgi:CubicO group peptidase (beta-lactamase class C family)